MPEWGEALPLNLDYSKRVTINTKELPWQKSAHSGINRKFLEREKIESGIATSIVVYEPGTYFKKHSHPLGEEIFVLSGCFEDENGQYPEGSYLRNPPNSEHAPFSEQGCVLFVKLNHLSPFDKLKVAVNTSNTAWLAGHGNLKVMPLHQASNTSSSLVFWPAGEHFTMHSHFGGEEIYVLKGTFKDEHGDYPQGTWTRSPHLSSHNPYVTEDTTILVKVGHLAE